MPNDALKIPDIGQIAEQASKIKLGGGVVGKLSAVLIVVVIACAAIAIATRDIWVSLSSLAVLFVLVFVIGSRLLRFAEKNPYAALMEGAELLAHDRIMLAMKGKPDFALITSDETDDPESPPQILIEGDAKQPDALPEASPAKRLEGK